MYDELANLFGLILILTGVVILILIIFAFIVAS